MEILFISHKYPPTIGGMEKQCYELIAQSSVNHIVHKLVYTFGSESKLSFFVKLKSRVKDLLKSNPEIDIIHLNDGLMGMFLLWLKKYTSIPVVVTFHGLDLIFPNKLYQRVISKKFTKYDAAICVSKATAQECLNRNFNSQKVFVVPNGVDHQISNYQSDKSKFTESINNRDISNKKIIAMMGRPVKRKGFSWFLKEVVPKLEEDILIVMIGPLSNKNKVPFWKKLLPQSIRSQIDLASQGMNDEIEISQILQDKAVSNKVIQTGKIPFEEVLEILSLAKLFVMPNIKVKGDAEGFGLVALEASLRQTVVLASDLEGIPEAIQNGKNGYLLPSGKVENWVEKINELLNSTDQLEKTERIFKQFTLENYSWEKMTSGYIEVFKKIINKI